MLVLSPFQGIIGMSPDRHILLVMLGAGFWVPSVGAVTVYRIGIPFSAAETDSLSALGIGTRQIRWEPDQGHRALDLDALATGVLQPDSFAVDEDIGAIILDRGGRVWIKTFASENSLSAQVLLDRDPSTALEWRALFPESFTQQTNQEAFSEKMTFDLGGQFRIREFRFRPLEHAPYHFLESFSIGVSDVGFDVFRIPIFPAVSRGSGKHGSRHHSRIGSPGHHGGCSVAHLSQNAKGNRPGRFRDLWWRFRGSGVVRV